MSPDSLLIKNIVVGLDYSPYSRVVLRQARFLAQKFNATLHALYAEEDAVLAGAFAPLTASHFYLSPTPEQMEEDLRTYYRLEDTVVVRTAIGGFPDNIIRYADTLSGPLIVIGAYGHSAFSRFLLGNYAEQVAMEAKCPVWVHRGRKVRAFRNILLPVDLSGSSQRTVDLFRVLPELFSVRLNYLYVQAPTVQVVRYDAYEGLKKYIKREVQKLLSRFRKKNPGLRLKVISGDPAREIIVRGRKHDVLALAPHGRPGPFRRFGRVSAKVIRMASVPVLIIKPD